MYKDYVGLANTPINGMPHLAYLGQMLESGMGLVIPKELVLSRDCPNPFKLHLYSLLLCYMGW